MSSEHEFVTACRDLVRVLEEMGPDIPKAELTLKSQLKAALEYYDRQMATRQAPFSPLCKPPEQSPSSSS